MELVMTRKELNEIKSQYTLEDCGILRLCGCYVDGERNKITQFNENFLNLPEEEKHKYFDIFKKTLSGTPGKNLVDMKFNVDAYADEGARTFLMNLRDSGLKDDRLLNEFYDRIINNYSYVGNYLILLINQVYDIPAVTTDNIEMDDASDEVYSYILCSICHVNLSKPGLGYDEEDNNFHDKKQNHMVDVPDVGFLFPAFNKRSADEDMTLFYTKDVSEFEDGLIDCLLDCAVPLPAKQQKETFTSLVNEALGEEADLEIVKNIHENLEQIIEEKKQESPAPVMLDKTEMKDLLEKSGVKEEKLENFEEHFEMAAGEHGKLVASNVSSGKKFEVKTPDVVIKINSDKTDIVSTQVIDGRQCLVIQIDERLEVNGISVNPDTGEVIDRTAEGYVEE
ncbi:DUF4317 domain-containing protein [Lachnospira eligens]|jgi:hypothetical protein|uniref:DUF4317 domain-containing protein n=3 Tax=Lachnospira eligens TaxID=39485 RepID=A0A414DHS9_9FIRM|nr:DUF4317 domain-containing protein [Lachnospira sp.]MBS5259890.1 DUF4317 domain-containing protein [Lachnospira eligens]HCF06493.1 DUF4317 domain-containing protein [Eubacterium sp.]MBS6300833.1 DUF4317 domain-containing protein [Lachnospira eligens]RGW89950.1 DUF4317 domain-containing protein [Lachnospira eligens]